MKKFSVGIPQLQPINPSLLFPDLFAVYALNTNEQRKELWSFINMQYQQIYLPMFMGGDFNAILSPEDRLQGQPVTLHDIEDFQECIHKNELHEIRAIGSQFTWNNNREGGHRIWSNIDRCFANDQWLDMFSRVVVERLENGVSDHSPQLLKFDMSEPQHGLFKFYNVLADHEQFEGIVKEHWGRANSQNFLRNIWMNCKHLKRPLKALNTTWFRKTSERVAAFRVQLGSIQQRMDHTSNSELIQEEKQLLVNLEKWSNIEESD